MELRAGRLEAGEREERRERGSPRGLGQALEGIPRAPGPTPAFTDGELV